MAQGSRQCLGPGLSQDSQDPHGPLRTAGYYPPVPLFASDTGLFMGHCWRARNCRQKLSKPIPEHSAETPPDGTSLESCFVPALSVSSHPRVSLRKDWQRLITGVGCTGRSGGPERRFVPGPDEPSHAAIADVGLEPAGDPLYGLLLGGVWVWGTRRQIVQ